ncbi:crAss001_48 related protein [Parabacteroides distasonis]
MFKGLSTQKQVLLRAQFGAMEAYRQILIERIRIEGIAK